MGSNESKTTVPAEKKPEPAFKKTHTSHLVDPRSPSVGIDRTPIQIGDQESKVFKLKGDCPLAITDPRSPTVGITRTPIRDVMRATVGSLARRLGILFHNETQGKAAEGPQKHFTDSVEEVLEGEELASTVPLLSHHSSQNFGSLAEHGNLLVTPVHPSLQSMSDSSPFVLLEHPQVEVEIETEADITFEEAEEARASPLHNRLSMSLITCHEGSTSAQIYADVHHEANSFTGPSVEVEALGDGADHSYALPSVSVQPESSEPPASSDVDPSAQLKNEENPPSCEGPNEPSGELPSVLNNQPTPSKAKQPPVGTGIRCPTFDTKSPSQLEFKPQWLGKGFGATGLRARGVQGQNGRGGSSPLAVRIAVKNIANENKGKTGKLKQKDVEGRSPLQILKDNNSPRDQRFQVKVKVSAQDKPKLGQLDRRVLAVALDKENR
ncbi:cell division cycle-associated protein 3 [Oryzias melastigma]|uniref:Cell division cycle associated 3 n=1 Tax=Oryzias melastigma TaxID=30732 RepID=A0A3B3C5F4_ORYME|nr:cell division cycle-associated protein 3 [Oryzias melastigma]